MILDGKEVSRVVRDSVKARIVSNIRDKGRPPCLAIIVTSDDEASKVYVNSKKKACSSVGIKTITLRFAESASEDLIYAHIRKMGASAAVDGIIVQLPMCAGLNEGRLVGAIPPSKDVDGLTPVNQGKALLGADGIRPCTPLGVLELLDGYGIETEGKDVCILGRSNLVGRPLAAMLAAKGKDATVTLLHSKSGNIEEHLKRADIIVSAMGNSKYIKADMVASGATIIDVGIVRNEDGTLSGDADFEDITSKVEVNITPVPGGVGPMTVAMLLRNTLEVWLRK